jgi:hypothetical protein
LWRSLRDCEPDLRAGRDSEYRSARRGSADRRLVDSDRRSCVAILEARLAFTTPGNAIVPLFLAVLGGTLAMIGPGTWSVDAWMFGRRHIVPPDL